MLDVILDTLIDSVKLVPFLFLAYLAMEYLEHKAGESTVKMVRKAGKMGPLIGGVAGIMPQCGFSAAASNLYAGRVITLGTLIAIYLSTSDEMLPILISEKADVRFVLGVLGANWNEAERSVRSLQSTVCTVDFEVYLWPAASVSVMAVVPDITKSKL